MFYLKTQNYRIGPCSFHFVTKMLAFYALKKSLFWGRLTSIQKVFFFILNTRFCKSDKVGPSKLIFKFLTNVNMSRKKSTFANFHCTSIWQLCDIFLWNWKFNSCRLVYFSNLLNFCIFFHFTCKHYLEILISFLKLSFTVRKHCIFIKICFCSFSLY